MRTGARTLTAGAVPSRLPGRGLAAREIPRVQRTRGGAIARYFFRIFLRIDLEDDLSAWTLSSMRFVTP